MQVTPYLRWRDPEGIVHVLVTRERESHTMRGSKKNTVYVMACREGQHTWPQMFPPTFVDEMCTCVECIGRVG